MFKSWRPSTAKQNIAVLIGDDFAYPDAFDNFR